MTDAVCNLPKGQGAFINSSFCLSPHWAGEVGGKGFTFFSPRLAAWGAGAVGGES